ncbi:MAG: hypothetical protein Q7R39_02075 [Dehalococcoidia bacterium]|nr:hypothetical protein [Dehalococcoidia bacterium]
MERILYLPGLKDSGDIEAGTKTITAVAKPGSPDYTTSLTTDAPSDARLAVTQMAARLQLTIDSMTAGHLYGELHVNGVNRKTFDFTSTGAKLAAIDLSAGQFNVGSANTLEVYLWVDSGNAVVSLCQLWQAVGQQRTIGPFACLEIHHSGFLQLGFWADRLGSGAITVRGDLRGGDDFNTALAL